MTPFESMLKSRKFWMAIFALVVALMNEYVPGFPPSIWETVRELVILVIGMNTVEDVARHIANGRTG